MPSNIPGVDFQVAPVMTQAQIDERQEQSPGRQRYRLTQPGTITLSALLGPVTVMGPQLNGAVASQLVWLSPTDAAGFGSVIELAP